MTATGTRLAPASQRAKMAAARSGQTAVIVVDCQLDFMPGGALPVPEGDQIIPLVNELLDWADVRCATKDWHPNDDPSFTENGGEWPRHCVVYSRGARFHPGLCLDYFRHPQSIFEKTGYSAFSEPTGSLETWLRERSVTRVVVCGLALDYCVKATAVDAAKRGFKVFAPLDATRAVNPRAIPDIEAAFRLQGIAPCYTEDLLKPAQPVTESAR